VQIRPFRAFLARMGGPPRRDPGDASATISIREAARRAGVGVRAMRGAVLTGQVASIMIGRRHRVLLEPFEALLRGGRVIKNEEAPGE
jgi:hypothetical protein